MDDHQDWPVLRRYDDEHLEQIAMPLGGIGTGTVSLGGRGDLRDWEITGIPRKGYRKPTSFFLLRCVEEDGAVQMRALESELQPPFEHSRGFDEPGRFEPYGLPRFRNGAFHAAYPLGQVLLSDPDNVRTTLRSVFERNFVEMRRNPNFFRAFALNEERALVFGTYPEEDVPEVPMFRLNLLGGGSAELQRKRTLHAGEDLVLNVPME